jgi:hypothetical protein
VSDRSRALTDEPSLTSRAFVGLPGADSTIG